MRTLRFVRHAGELFSEPNRAGVRRYLPVATESHRHRDVDDAFLTSWSSASEALDTQSAQTGLEYSMEDVGVRFLSSNIDHVDTDLATEYSRPVCAD